MAAAIDHYDEPWEPAMALTRQPRHPHSRSERYRVARALGVGKAAHKAWMRSRA